MQYVYAETTTGALLAVRECVANASDTGCDPAKGQTYWEAQDVNAAGAVTQAALGNGLTTDYTYDLAAGVLNGIQTTGAGGNIQSLTYGWDIYGNLTSRTDTLFNGGANGGFVETFTYDNLNRLKQTATDYNLTVEAPVIERFTHYAKNGNIACFNVDSSSTCTASAANYTYHGSKVHAVASKTGTGGGVGAYTYNANGSMLTGPDREIAWTAFNKPALICKGAIDDITGVCDTTTWSQFKYDPSRARYAQVTATSTTTYVGALYERVEVGGVTTHKFHIFAGGSAVAIYSCTVSCGSDPGGVVADGTKDETFYFHKDHLGSINVITDGHGMEQERFTYTAWGEQQSWSAATSTFEPASSAKQTRGYTGHEMLNDLGLIYMGQGRLYDQNLGRFISADPFVQFPESTQGYNRYSYVGNNPLSYTDPSGYFSFKEALGIVVGIIGAVSCPVTAGLGCALASGALTGAVGGYLATGTLKGALTGAVLGMASAGISFGIGAHFGHQLDFGAQLFKKSLAHGFAQGALSVAGGGRFGDGFLGAFASSMASPVVRSIKGIDSGARAARIAVAAVVGGTASKLGGGRFANGAISGAFVQAYNDELAAQQFKKTLEEFRTNTVAHENVSVTEEDDVTKISINGTVGGAVAKTIVDEFIDGVKTAWQGTFKFDGKTYEVSVNLERSGVMPPDFELRVVHSETFYRSHAMHGGNVGTIWWKASPGTMAHEFGHMLGFGDMYTDSGGVYSGFEKDIMGSSQRGGVQGYHAAILALRYGQ